MPFHGVGLIVGGTIAVIGSGYAFKKLVYDPHLAHYVEAFIAQHPLLHALSQSASSTTTEDPRRGNLIPALAASSATSSARQPSLTQARRRRSVRERDEGSMGLELETRQPLLRAGEREEYYLDADGLDDWGKSRRAAIVIKLAERAESGSSQGIEADREDDTSVSHSLVDLNGPIHHPSAMSSHARDIRSIIFDRDEPSSSPFSLENESTPTPANLSQLLSPPTVPSIPEMATSTISTPSAPRSRPSALSDSWSSSGTRAVVPTPGSDLDTLADPFVDVASDGIPIFRPGTAESDFYVDAESYTPDEYADRGASPTRTFPAFPTSPTRAPEHQELASRLTAAAVARHDGGVAADMGMSYIRLQIPAVAASEAGSGSARRGPMSVVSMSESEGGRSEDDWEAI